MEEGEKKREGEGMDGEKITMEGGREREELLWREGSGMVGRLRMTGSQLNACHTLTHQNEINLNVNHNQNFFLYSEFQFLCPILFCWFRYIYLSNSNDFFYRVTAR